MIYEPLTCQIFRNVEKTDDFCISYTHFKMFFITRVNLKATLSCVREAF